MAGEEGKILSDGVMLLITSLLSGIVSLIVYVWVSSRREHAEQIKKIEKKIEDHETTMKNHEGRLIHLETEHNNNTCRRGKKK